MKSKPTIGVGVMVFPTVGHVVIAIRRTAITALVWPLIQVPTLSLIARAEESSSTAVSGATSSLKASFAPPKANRLDTPRERFQAAKSFYTYYGEGRAAELSHYDIAILHTSRVRPEDVKRLSELGVVTVGYITIGEDEKLQTGNGRGPGGKASWYFDSDQDGQPDQDPIWRSWYANTNDLEWRASRVAEAKRLIDEYGFDGIFLDLISVSEMYPECREGMIAMMRELRETLPDGVIVMNQGFDIVGDVASLADGFMMESFTATYDFENKRYLLNDPVALDFHLRRAQKLLSPAVDKQPLRVLVLDYAGPEDHDAMQFAANRAASLGYLFSVSPILLDDVYANVPQGESDPKWLKHHSSIDHMTWKLPKAANGFPAGTAVTPSGSFAGYSVVPMFESTADRTQVHWSKAAWASGEDGDSAWLEISLPQVRSGGTLEILWHDAAGPSRNFKLQIFDGASENWKDVESIEGNELRTTRHQLPSSPYQRIRLVQPPDGGSLGRPKLMWITRLELID